MYSVYHIYVEGALDKGYIGISKNPEARFIQHRWNRFKSNQHLHNAFIKYKDQIKMIILASDVTKEVACFIESLLRPYENMGWNIAKGGSVPPSPKGKIRSAEHCKNISLAKQGDRNPMFGKNPIFSKEHKRKLSLAARQAKVLKCPHCDKEGRTNGMKRWHFDKCNYENK